MVVIVDYGMANLRSVQKAVEKCGFAAQVTSDPRQVGKADRLILPGVGAFRDAIAKLRSTGLDRPILDHIYDDKPFLGICLGLQLLFTVSYEDGEHEGLDVFPGKVISFDPAKVGKVPHMGWNVVRPPSSPLAPVRRGEGSGVRGSDPLGTGHAVYPVSGHNPLSATGANPSPPTPLPGVPGRGGEEHFLAGLPEPAWMYFVHSYYVVPDNPVLTALECDYGGKFCAAIAKGRLFATQFHPEKSQQTGLWLLHKFLTLC